VNSEISSQNITEKGRAEERLHRRKQMQNRKKERKKVEKRGARPGIRKTEPKSRNGGRLALARVEKEEG
jgi:hypothetical protein